MEIFNGSLTASTSSMVSPSSMPRTSGEGPIINIVENKVYFASNDMPLINMVGDAESFTKEEQKRLHKKLWKSKTAEQF